jgi:hypothetical protein
MLEKLEHSQLKQITLHNDAVHWYKQGKEVMVDSKLFDVHSFSVQNDSTVLKGLFDDEETLLKDQVRKLLTESDKKNSSRALIIAKLMLQIWFNNHEREAFEPGISSIRDIKHVIEASRMLFGDLSVPFPPPKASLT